LPILGKPTKQWFAMKRILLSAIFSLFLTIVFAQIKVACIGNSITQGQGMKKEETYPGQLQLKLGSDWDVRNFGHSGRTLLRHGDFPYVNEVTYTNAKDFAPDVVLIKLGTNDAKPQNWKFKDEFIADYNAMIKEIQSLPSKPIVILCLPVPAYATNFRINDTVVNGEIQRMVREVAKQNHLQLIDLYTPLSNHKEWFPDNIHPNPGGTAEMARVVAAVLQKDKKKIKKNMKKRK